MCYVAKSLPFVLIFVYMSVTMCSATLVFPFSHVIITILFPSYEFINTCNVAVHFCFPFFNIVPIVITYFPNVTCFYAVIYYLSGFADFQVRPIVLLISTSI